VPASYWACLSRWAEGAARVERGLIVDDVVQRELVELEFKMVAQKKAER
jgi:hypothetical protein